jgi:cell division protein FtsB
MIEKRKKRDSREERIFQILFPIFTLTLIGLLLISNLKINQKRATLEEEIESLKKEIEILEEKKQKLEAGLSQTEKESYWEEKIRQEGYMREGENPVVILPPKETPEEKVVENQPQPIFNRLGCPALIQGLWQKLPEKFLDSVRNLLENVFEFFKRLPNF